MNQQQTSILKIFSVIAYLRNIFKEDSYTTRKEDGMKMRVLQRNNETGKYMEWIEAIENNFDKIEVIVLGIWVEGQLIEKYVISKKQEYNIKSLCSRIEKWPMINGRIKIMVQLYSYCDLEITGFVKSKQSWEIKDCKEYNVEGVRICRVKEGPDEIDEGEKMSCAQDIMNSKGGNEILIRCICYIDNKDGEMLQCDYCKKWMHTHCVGFFSNNDKRIPAKMKCMMCRGKFNIAQRNLAIYRRTLGIIYNEPFKNMNYLISRLGISRTCATSIFKALRNDGFIKYINKNSYSIEKKSETKKKLKEYFSGPEMECSVSIENIEFDCV